MLPRWAVANQEAAARASEFKEELEMVAEHLASTDVGADQRLQPILDRVNAALAKALAEVEHISRFRTDNFREARSNDFDLIFSWGEENF